MKITNNKKKTLEKALDELLEVRKQFKVLRTKITELNQIVEKNGGFPQVRERSARNKRIYKRWTQGHSFTLIAEEFGLSPTTIGSICKRINKRMEKRRKVSPVK